MSAAAEAPVFVITVNKDMTKQLKGNFVLAHGLKGYSAMLAGK